MNKQLETSEKYKAYLALTLGIIALTLSPLFVRWADAPGMITSFYRMLITSIVLFPFLLRFVRKHGLPKWRYFIFALAAGSFSALDHGFWSTGLEHTAVANATLLNYISPLWVALFAVVFWKERLGGRFWLGLFGTLTGAVVLLGSTMVIRPSFALGDVLAVMSSFFFAGYFLFTQSGRRHLETLPFLWGVMASAMVWLLIGSQVMGLPLTGYSQQTYLTFLAAALISQLGGYFFITYALGKLPASVVTPTMVAQPVLTALLAVPFAGELLTLGQVVGGGITLVGVYLVNTARKEENDLAKEAVR